ncbi:TetR family transcriptional regulator [Novosphingobium sp.]|uniref:TetR family transcriptional regulator n=1 Tax=Novosphingobium sp. TaxID=1874826 RepID=UPI00352AB578
MARHRDIALDRSGIVAAAFALLDEAGLDGVTMRALAARLSVQAPALYWHVRDKAALGGLMAEALYAEARAGLHDGLDTRAWLLALGRGLCRSLARHRDAARLLASARPLAQASDETAAGMAAPLVQRGFSREQALEAQAAVLSLSLGWSIYRENAAMHAFLTGMFDLEESFEHGLRVLVDGLVAEAVPASS